MYSMVFQITISYLMNDCKGDALREIDVQQVIHGDFVLISGDVVTNTNLLLLLQKHTRTKLIDKNCIMTIVCHLYFHFFHLFWFEGYEITFSD